MQVANVFTPNVFTPNVFTYDETHMAAEAQNLVSLGRFDSFQPKIAAAIKIMEARIDEPVPIQSIADTLKMSIRALEMLFHKTVQISPGKFYRHLRLQAARRMIIDTRLSIQQIAVRTGFGSASAFSRAFGTERFAATFRH